MARLVAICFAWVLALLTIASSASDRPAGEILERARGPTPILTDLEQLTDDIGGRPSGSTALSQAIAWGIEKFRAAGLENVRSEPYTVPILWLPGAESGAVIQPNRRTLAIAALPFSSGTGPSGIEAVVASVGHGDEADFAIVKSKVLGRWVLIETVPMRSIDDVDVEYLNAPRIFLAAREAGAVGVLWMSTRPGRLLYRHSVRFDDAIDPLPGAMLDREDASRISRARQLARGKTVRVKLVTEPRILRNVVLANVVGEVHGATKPAESVVLGAHLDSWDLGQGALDNGCVLVIDAERQIAVVAREHRPRRSTGVKGYHRHRPVKFRAVQPSVRARAQESRPLVFPLAAVPI